MIQSFWKALKASRVTFNRRSIRWMRIECFSQQWSRGKRVICGAKTRIAISRQNILGTPMILNVIQWSHRWRQRKCLMMHRRWTRRVCTIMSLRGTRSSLCRKGRRIMTLRRFRALIKEDTSMGCWTTSWIFQWWTRIKINEWLQERIR